MTDPNLSNPAFLTCAAVGFEIMGACGLVLLAALRAERKARGSDNA